MKTNEELEQVSGGVLPLPSDPGGVLSDPPDTVIL